MTSCKSRLVVKMQGCDSRISITLLLLFAISVSIVRSRDCKTSNLWIEGIKNIQNLYERNDYYKSLHPVDKYDVGTSDDRERILDQKVANQEQFKFFYEGILAYTNYYNLPPEEQAQCQAVFKSDPKIKQMTTICQKFTKNPPKCDEKYPYRTFDGTCNNLKNPTWGSVLECTRRIFPPYYENVNEFRKSVTGTPLPNPRKLSTFLHNHLNRLNDKVCHMSMFFGQFNDHDLTKTAASSAHGVDLQSCAPVKKRHPQCAPLYLDRDDSFYKTFNKTCINFVRSAPCSTCDFSYRVQMNTMPTFIDCSHVYGVTKEKADELRAMDGSGKLKAQFSVRGELLPPNKEKGSDCGEASKGEYCFNAGDPRVNEHSPIMSLHTVFLRYHNSLCDGLKKYNPHWDDEKLYQESRKMVIAVFQHITFHEWILFIVGQKLTDRYSLRANEGTKRIKYDPKVDPTVHTEFATAAYRLHSTIGKIVSKYLEDKSKKCLRQEFNDAEPLYRKGINELLSGIMNTESQQQDRAVVNDVTNFLYRKRKAPYGLDLAAINLQRGRDHGLAPYYIFVQFCSGKEIKCFDDLIDYMPQCNIDRLSKMYKDVRDIDAWSGMQMERPLYDGVVGPTAACIIAREFYTRKFGDRFYYENPGIFTDKQLLEIKNMTLSSLFCRTTNITEISTFAFLCPNQDINPLVFCRDLRQIDLSCWKE